MLIAEPRIKHNFQERYTPLHVKNMWFSATHAEKFNFLSLLFVTFQFSVNFLGNIPYYTLKTRWCSRCVLQKILHRIRTATLKLLGHLNHQNCRDNIPPIYLAWKICPVVEIELLNGVGQAQWIFRVGGSKNFLEDLT